MSKKCGDMINVLDYRLILQDFVKHLAIDDYNSSAAVRVFFFYTFDEEYR